MRLKLYFKANSLMRLNFLNKKKRIKAAILQEICLEGNNENLTTSNIFLLKIKAFHQSCF